MMKTSTESMRKTALRPLGGALLSLYDSPRFDKGRRSRRAGHDCHKDHKDNRHWHSWRKSRRQIRAMMQGQPKY